MAPSRPAVCDISKPWRLSHILSGHTSDVKSVCCSQIPKEGSEDEIVEIIHSASRDETARSWYRTINQRDQSVGHFRQGRTFQGHRYQNAVTYVSSKEGIDGKVKREMTIMGGLDSRILVFSASPFSWSEKFDAKPSQVLSEHLDNVCHLDFSSFSDKGKCKDDRTLLISASWDCTARVFELVKGRDVEEWKLLHTLKGHERAVWDARVVCSEPGREQYITTSADLFVRLWDQDRLSSVYAGHKDVVRGLSILPASEEEVDGCEASTSALPSFYPSEPLFVTSSNDGSLRVWSLDKRRRPSNNEQNGGEPLRTLIPSEADGGSTLIYDVQYMAQNEDGERLVVSSGEDGLLRGWNIENGTVDFSIPQPVSSIWALSVSPVTGDIVTANSDGLVRVFTQRPARENTSKEVLASSSIPEVSEEELKEHARHCDALAGKRRVRSEVVSRADGGPSSTFEGRSYDAVLQIDVSDDAEPLALPINRGDDPREAAKDFIRRYNLPTSYEDQIVEFIATVRPDATT